MKKFVTVRFTLVALGLLAVAVWFIPFNTIAQKTMEFFNDDPDVPGFLKKAKSQFSKEEFFARRNEQIALYRGMKDGKPEENLRVRNQEIAKMEQQIDALRARPASPTTSALLAAWQPIGPNPIPNGQTTGHLVRRFPVASQQSTFTRPIPTSFMSARRRAAFIARLNGGTNWTPFDSTTL